MAPRAGPDILEKKKNIIDSTGIRTSDRPARSLVAIPATLQEGISNWIELKCMKKIHTASSNGSIILEGHQQHWQYESGGLLWGPLRTPLESLKVMDVFVH